MAHIAEIQWVELVASGDIEDDAEVSVTLTMGTPCTTDTGKLGASVGEMMGVYNVKSDTYEGDSVTITLSTSGVARWTDADNVVRGASTGK